MLPYHKGKRRCFVPRGSRWKRQVVEPLSSLLWWYGICWDDKSSHRSATCFPVEPQLDSATVHIFNRVHFMSHCRVHFIFTVREKVTAYSKCYSKSNRVLIVRYNNDVCIIGPFFSKKEYHNSTVRIFNRVHFIHSKTFLPCTLYFHSERKSNRVLKML